jgi:hypothetical protein
MVLGFAVLLIIAGLAWAWHWRTHPTVFPEAGNRIGLTLDDGRRIVAVGVTYPYPGTGKTVSIESAAPRILKNSADASFDFYICEQDLERPDGSALGMVVGTREFSRYCPDAQPVQDGTDLNTGSVSPQQLVLVLRSGRQGRAVTEGVNLTYSTGLQGGTQAVGPHLRIEFR